MSWRRRPYQPRHWRPSEAASIDESECYADILATIRRQGFFDPIGADLPQANFNNGNYPMLVEGDFGVDREGRPIRHAIVGARSWHPKTRRHRYAIAAAKAQEAYEQEQRARQLERERIADRQWREEEWRRKAELQPAISLAAALLLPPTPENRSPEPATIPTRTEADRRAAEDAATIELNKTPARRAAKIDQAMIDQLWRDHFGKRGF